jgi:ankyrin repeat protein
MESSAIITTQDDPPAASLHYAAQKEDEVRLLIKSRVSVHALNSSGKTPLHWATMSVNEAVARLLIKKGA